MARSTRALLDWMEEEGLGDPDLQAVDWGALGYGQVRAELMMKMVEPLERFFATHTREELSKGSVERRILLFSVATHKDLYEHPQLEARSYFRELPHGELGDTISYQGAFVRTPEDVSVGPHSRPPLIGEHNTQIYQDELGLTSEQMSALRESGVI